MNPRFLFVVLGLVVLAVACSEEETAAPSGSSNGGSGSSGVTFSCASWCDAGAPLGCGGARCLEECDASFATFAEYPSCSSELATMKRCLAELSASSLSCTSDGSLEPKGTRCGAEQQAFLDCAKRGGTGGAAGSAGNAGAAGAAGSAGSAGSAGNAGSGGSAGSAGAGGAP